MSLGPSEKNRFADRRESYREDEGGWVVSHGLINENLESGFEGLIAKMRADGSRVVDLLLSW